MSDKPTKCECKVSDRGYPAFVVIRCDWCKKRDAEHAEMLALVVNAIVGDHLHSAKCEADPDSGCPDGCLHEVARKLVARMVGAKKWTAGLACNLIARVEATQKGGE